MKTGYRLSVLALMVVGQVLAAADAPPELSQCTDSPRCDATMVVTGEGFDKTTDFVVWTPDKVHPAFLPKAHDVYLQSLAQPLPTPPAAPPKDFQAKLKVLAVDAQVAALEVPRMPRHILGRSNHCRHPFTGFLYARNAKGWSRPIAFNRPVLYFVDRYTVHPGEQLRIVGRNLNSWGQGFVVLRQAKSGKVVEPKRISRYAHGSEGRLRNHQRVVQLPADLGLGSWDVYVHNTTGRAWGWSAPLRLTVAKRTPPLAEKVVNVRDSGAKGDAATDDTAALQKALDLAGAASGTGKAVGVVYLPAGRYHVRRTLRIPIGVTVRGVGRRNSTIVAGGPVPFGGEPEPIPGLAKSFHNPEGTHYYTVMWGKTDFRLEHLAVEGLGESAGVLLATQNGDQPSRNVVIENCRFYNEGKQQARGKEWIWTDHGKKYAKWFKGVAGGVQHDLRLAHCEFEGNAGTWFWNILHSYIGFNKSRTWQWHSGGAGINPRATMRHTIFEFNDKTGPRGFIMHGWDEHHHYRNLFYANKAHDTQTWDGEGLLVEGAGKVYGARVADATRDSVTLDGGQFTENQLRDKCVVIVRGRGLGQYRMTTGNTGENGRTIRLAEPWRVVPDKGARITVMGGTVENIFAVNFVYHSYGGGPLLYHCGGMGNEVFGNRVFASASSYLWSTRRRKADVNDKEAFTIVPDYWNVYWGNQLYDQAKFFFTFGMGGVVKKTVRRLEGVLQIGNAFRGNAVLRPYNLRLGHLDVPAAINFSSSSYRRFLKEKFTGTDPYEAAYWFNVAESNRILGSAVGIYVSERSYGVVLRNNTFEQVDKPVDDKGMKTVVLEDSH